MQYEEILYEVEGGVATITLHRPEKLNAWTLRMGAEVRHAFLRADRDEGVRAIVVTGAGRGYCAGADMDMLRSVRDGTRDAELSLQELGAEPEGESDDGAADPQLAHLRRGPYSFPIALGKPVLAAVNGIAAGLGFSYLLFYDMRIASEQARFATLFSRRGLIAEHGAAWLLPRLVGLANACDLLFSGRTIDAHEALRMGLVNRVVPHDELLPETRRIARELAEQCSPRSLRIMKRQIYGGLFRDLAAAIDEADREMLASFLSEDFREGISAYLEKRSPRFTGR